MLDLEQIKKHTTDVKVECVSEIICDLWDNFMNEEHADVVQRGMIDDYDVEKFQKWASKGGYTILTQYLPKSSTRLTEIIKFCLNQKANAIC